MSMLPEVTQYLLELPGKTPRDKKQLHVQKNGYSFVSPTTPQKFWGGVSEDFVSSLTHL